MRRSVSRQWGMFLVVGLFATVAVSCGGGQDADRDRNVQAIAGQPCKKLGVTQTVAKVVNVCGRNGTELVWYAAVAKKPAGKQCTRPGGFRTASPNPLVCAVIGKKRMWIAVAPMPGMAATTLPNSAGEVAASGNSSVVTSPTVAPPTTSPAAAEIPSKPIDPSTTAAVAKASAPATRLSLITKAATSRNGDPMFPAPVVQLVDDAGQARPVAGVRVRAVLAVGGYEVTGDVALTTADGSATFSELRALGAAGRIDVSFVAVDYGGTTQEVTHEIGEAVSLKWMPFSDVATAGVEWAAQPSVQLVDAAGQAVKRSGVNLVYVATLGKGKPSPLGMIETDADGIGVFRGVSIETAGQFSTRVVAPAESLESPSRDVSIHAADAKGLVVTSHIPDTMGSAVSYGDVMVQVVDQFGNPVRQAGVRVSAQATSWDFGPEIEVATLKANDADGYDIAAVTNGEGIATFANFSITGWAGIWNLQFKNSEDSTWRFAYKLLTLDAGLPVALKFAVQPSGFRSGLAPDVVPQIQVVDSAGNRVVSVAGEVAAVADNGVTVEGGKATFDDEGLARFDKLKLTGKVGDVALSFAVGATLANLTTTVALGYGAVNEFVVTELPNTVTVGEGFTISIELRDSAQNVVKTQGIVAGLEVLSTSRNTMSRSGVVSGNTGTLTFTVDKIEFADDYYVGLSVITDVAPKKLFASAQLSVRAADAAHVEFQSTAAIETRSGEAFPSTITAQVVDRFGNKVAKAGVRVNAEVIGRWDPAVAEGLSALTDNQGRATFDKLKLAARVGEYTLLFSVDKVGVAVTYPGAIVVKAGAAAELVIVRGAAGLMNREYAAIQPIIQLVDSAGNNVPQSGVTITASIGPSSRPGVRGEAVTDATGRASFTKVMAEGDAIGSNSAITFFASRLTSVQQRGVTIAAGRPTKFNFGMTDRVASGSAFSRITATDVDGNSASMTAISIGVVYDGVVASSTQLKWAVTKDGVGYIFGVAGTKVRIELAAYSEPGRILATHKFTISTDPKIGDPGPAGGVIFHVLSADKRMSAVPSISSGGRFLEAAPVVWHFATNVSPTWTLDSLIDSFVLDGKSTKFGVSEGGKNTASIVTQQAKRGSIFGPKMVESLSIGGYDDWFLPSRDEFQLLLGRPPLEWRPACGDVTKFMTSSLAAEKRMAFFYDSTNAPWTVKFLSVETRACVVPIRAFG